MSRFLADAVQTWMYLTGDTTNDMAIRKVNFSLFPELSPCFKFSVDNRYTQRRCSTCRKRVGILYMQDNGGDGPQLANAERPPAWCWACAVEAQSVMWRLAPADEPGGVS